MSVEIPPTSGLGKLAMSVEILPTSGLGQLAMPVEIPPTSGLGQLSVSVEIPPTLGVGVGGRSAVVNVCRFHPHGRGDSTHMEGRSFVNVEIPPT